MTVYDWNELIRKKQEPEPRALVPVTEPATGYAHVALDNECALVATAPQGQRNATLNKAAFNLGQLIPAGHLDEGEVRTALTNAARASGLPDHEIAATLASGLKGGKQHPRDIKPLPPPDLVDLAALVAPVAGGPVAAPGRPLGGPVALGMANGAGAAPRAGTGQPASLPPARTSWWPLAIAVRAREATTAPAPTHLWREDGVCLFYSGKVNGLLGESESGKTWVALKAIADALLGGERVLLLDFEDSPGSIFERLTALGVDADALALLDYANPDEALGLAQSADLAEALGSVARRNALDAPVGDVLADHLEVPGAEGDEHQLQDGDEHDEDGKEFHALSMAGYHLIVVDGVNAAMTLLGYDLNSNTDATLFATKLLRPLARTGACVVTVDHVTKARDNRVPGGIGAQAKRAMMDGCALAVTVIEPFGKGQSGVLKLAVDKDRPGHVRGQSAGGREAGRAMLDSHEDGTVSIRIVASEERPKGLFRPTGLMEKVSRFLEDATGPVTGNVVKAGVGGKADNVAKALAVLVAEGYVALQPGPRGAHLHTSTKAYAQHDDPASDVYDDRFPAVPTGSPPVPGNRSVTGSPVPPPYKGEPVEPVTPTWGLVRGKEDDGPIPEGYSNCNRCGKLLPDWTLNEGHGYCRTCR